MNEYQWRAVSQREYFIITVNFESEYILNNNYSNLQLKHIMYRCDLKFTRHRIKINDIFMQDFP